MFASLQATGQEWVDRDKFHKAATIGDRTIQLPLITQKGTRSGPVAVLFIFERAISTSYSLNLGGENSGESIATRVGSV